MTTSGIAQAHKHNAISVVQLGARMHYAVPRIFHRAGILETLYTDFHLPKSWEAVLRKIPVHGLPRAARRVISRQCKDLPAERIRAYNRMGVRYAWLLAHAASNDQRTQIHFRIGDEMSQRIMQDHNSVPSSMYVFDSTSLRLMQRWSDDCLFVMEQTNAPRTVMTRLLREEHVRHPGWSTEDLSSDSEDLVMDRYREAWGLAHVIVTGSDFVRKGMKECGAPWDKCRVVPYGVELPGACASNQSMEKSLAERMERRRLGQPLRILSVGSVSLRKGAPYVMRAAKHFGTKGEFKWAGGIHLTDAARQQVSQHVSLLGLVPRPEVQRLYEWADVFLLPSVCEGSATATYEALAYGLPVICTLNTGSVVQNGHDGFVVETSSGTAIIEAMERLLDDPELIVRMSEAAFAKARLMDLQHYGERLLAALELSGSESVGAAS